MCSCIYLDTCFQFGGSLPRSRIAGHMVIVFNLLKNCPKFSTKLNCLVFSAAMCENSNFSISSLIIAIFLLRNNYPSACKVVLAEKFLNGLKEDFELSLKFASFCCYGR